MLGGEVLMPEDNPRDWKSDPEKREKLVKKMARLLQEGHRMLDEICPRCDAVLFLRKDVNLRYCPNCDVFLASPEELERIDKRNIRVVGEYMGGKVIEYTGEKEMVTPVKEPRSVKAVREGIPKVDKEYQGDIVDLMDRLIVAIINGILKDLDYEIGRLSIKELFELLDAACKIRNRLRDKIE